MIARAASPIVIAADLLCLNSLWVGLVVVWMLMMRWILDLRA